LPPRPQAQGQGQATRLQQPPPLQQQQQHPPQQPQQQQQFQHQPQQQYPPQQQALQQPQQQQQFQLQHPSPSGPLPPPLQASYPVPPHGLAPGSGGGVHAILTSPPPARTQQAGGGPLPTSGVGDDWGAGTHLRRSLSSQEGGGYAATHQPHLHYPPPGLGSGGAGPSHIGPGTGEWRPPQPGDVLSSPVGTAGGFIGSGISGGYGGGAGGYGGHSTAHMDGGSGQRLPYGRSHHSTSNLASLGSSASSGNLGGGGGIAQAGGGGGSGSVGSGLGGGGSGQGGGDWFVGGDRERAAQLSSEPARLGAGGGGGERRAAEIQGLGQGRTGSGQSLDGSESGGAGPWYENEAQQAIDR